MVYTATGVQASNAAAILSAIETIATTNAGLTFAGSKAGNAPLPLEIAGRLPYLAVMLGDLIGYATAGTLQGVGRGMREPGEREPVWSYDVYAIYAYDQTNPNYAAPAAALVSLEAAYATYLTLNDTCALCSVARGTSRTYPVIAGKAYIASKLTLHVYERLAITYP